MGVDSANVENERISRKIKYNTHQHDNQYNLPWAPESHKYPSRSSWVDAAAAFAARDAFLGAACTAAAYGAAEAAAEAAYGVADAAAVAAGERAVEHTRIEVRHPEGAAYLGTFEFAAGVGYGRPCFCGNDQNYHADQLRHEHLPVRHLPRSTPSKAPARA
jgi:hypothetical protein